MNASSPLSGHQKTWNDGAGEQLKLQFHKVALVREQKSFWFGWLLYVIQTTA